MRKNKSTDDRQSCIFVLFLKFFKHFFNLLNFARNFGGVAGKDRINSMQQCTVKSISLLGTELNDINIEWDVSAEQLLQREAHLQNPKEKSWNKKIWAEILTNLDVRNLV